MTEIELLIRKNALKDVELWLNQQCAEIDKELMQFVEDRNDDSAKNELSPEDEGYTGEQEQ